MLAISRPIFNKINEDKKLISLRMLSENIDNGLKELSNPEIFMKNLNAKRKNMYLLIYKTLKI